MNTPISTYSPGQWVALTGTHCWLLIEMSIDDDRVTKLWEALTSDEATEAVLSVLLAKGLGSLPSFAFAAAQPTALRVVACNSASVTVKTGQGQETILGTSSGTWNDQLLTGEWTLLELSANSESNGKRLPLGNGITSASSLVISQNETSMIAVSEHDIAATEDDMDEAEPGDASEEASLMAVSNIEMEPEPTPEPAVEPAVEPVVEPTPDFAPSTPQESPGYYERLLGTTMDRDALLAELAKEEADDQDDAPADAPPADGAPTPESGDQVEGFTAIWQDPVDSSGEYESAAESESTHHPAPESIAGLIDGVPWGNPSSGSTFGSTPSVESEPAALPSFLPSADPQPSLEQPANADNSEPEAEVHTVNRAALLKAMQENTPPGSTVLAVTCPAGHLTSAYDSQCRVCGVQPEPQATVEVSRPPLGVLRLSTGQSILLDRDVILGRAPEDNSTDPATRPNLVQLTESGEVSRMHARVTLDGWQPLLRDLGSANGTMLTLQGSQPRQLRPDEDYPLEPGSVVSLAGIINFTFEVEG